MRDLSTLSCLIYFLGVEISLGPPNLPQITKNQILTKFCSKMSIYWFFENSPENKARHRKRICSIFFVKKFFNRQEVMFFCKKYFLGVEISGGPRNLRWSEYNVILRSWYFLEILNGPVDYGIFVYCINIRFLCFIQRNDIMFFVFDCFIKCAILFRGEEQFYAWFNLYRTSRLLKFGTSIWVR